MVVLQHNLMRILVTKLRGLLRGYILSLTSVHDISQLW